MAQGIQRKLRGTLESISSLAGGAMLLLGCGGHPATAANPTNVGEERFLKEALSTPQLEGSTPGSTKQAPHRVGDTVVHRFSGTFSKHALVLKEEVIEVGDETFTVRYTLDEGATMNELLVTRANRSERVVSVARVVEGRPIPGSVADYEALVGKTMFVPDQNHGEVATKSQTCLVGTAEHQCDIAEYRVYVADQEARLSVARSEELGRDVSGEVVAVDGTMIYRAELLEVDQQTISHTEEVAILSGRE